MSIPVADTSDPVIVSGSLVTLNFSLALSSGELVDSNFDKEPASFRVGDGNMLPGFEEELLGLGSGDELEKLIPSDRAFGAINEKNLQRFPLEKFRHLLDDDLVPTEAGSVVSFKDPGGFDLPGVVKEVSEKEVVVDFNHPLAGKDILFKVKIIAVLGADADTVELKV